MKDAEKDVEVVWCWIAVICVVAAVLIIAAGVSIGLLIDSLLG